MIEKFLSCPWLSHVCEPCDDARVFGTLEQLTEKLENDPDNFFAPPYSRPYENLCLVDHNAAEEISEKHKEIVTKAAESAFKTAWAFCDNGEFAGLISDDVRTSTSLILQEKPLHDFSIQRINWFLRGRAPWGYEGDFPNGRWIII